LRYGFRTTAALLVLIAGIVVSVRLDTGRDHSEAEPAAYSAAEPAVFELTLRRGSLVLAGNTVSAQHEEQLRRAAAEHFPNTTLSTSFRPLGVAPDWWNLATTELLSSLAAIESPTAVLKPDRLSVTGLVTSEAVAAMRLQALRDVLPDNLTFDFQFEKVATTATSDAMCARQFALLEMDPVKFEESGTEFRSSAYPVMDRIIALADACRNSTIAITGHTDSSGDENQNQQLSLARARAVAAYLGEKGIEPGRIEVAGAGSSLPVADNGTRYGRSLNRRIDVSMTQVRPD
jgi:OOP family OmpA-OmpF porin